MADNSLQNGIENTGAFSYTNCLWNDAETQYAFLSFCLIQFYSYKMYNLDLMLHACADLNADYQIRAVSMIRIQTE